MRRLSAVLLFAAALAAPAVSHARTRPAADSPAAATAPADDAGLARREALARRYFAAVKMDQQMSLMIRSLMPMMVQQQKAAHPNLTDAQMAAVTEATTEAMADFTPKYLDRVAGAYAQTFTEDELTQIVAFYESPVGQSVINKTPALMPQVTAILQDMLPELTENMKQKLCVKIACPAEPATPKT